MYVYPVDWLDQTHSESNIQWTVWFLTCTLVKYFYGIQAFLKNATLWNIIQSITTAVSLNAQLYKDFHQMVDKVKN